MIVRTVALDVGLTPEILAMVIVFALGGLGLFALVVGAIAVAIVGPRRWDAVMMPGIVVFILAVGLALFGRLDGSAVPWVVIAAFAVAIVTAFLQRGSLVDEDDPGASGIVVLGRVLVGLAIGAVVGLAGAAAMQNAFVLVICVAIGLLLGLRGAMSAEPPRDGGGPVAPPTDTNQPTAILDE
jgi:hypothetical protein